jgi:hypothetical protein
MSSFTAKKLDTSCGFSDTQHMKTANKKTTAMSSVADTVRRWIETGGERTWRFTDFQGLPFTAVAQSLSRLTRLGHLQRLGKGLYYRPRPTAFGLSKPNPAKLRELPGRRKAFPVGVGAANLLGFTTQNPARLELATDGTSLPRLIVGKETIIHTRRPESWRTLSETDAALLDFLRQRGEASELSPEETIRKLLAYFKEEDRLDRLVKAAPSEPPRVRAMLGAIGQQLGRTDAQLSALKKGLNPLSRFDFGDLAALKYAAKWQAKERARHETV